MNPAVRKIGLRFIITLVLVYVFGGIVLYFMQDKILFHPKPLARDYHFSFAQPFEEVNLPYKENDNLNLIRFRPPDKPKGIVLFFHGNMNNVEHYKKYPEFFLSNQYELWMIDYPGFGKTTGKLNENVLYDQALIMYHLAVGNVSGDSIIIYGKSMGTGIASYVASERKCRRLILETPYYSIPALARHYFPFYPTSRMIKFDLPVYKHLQKTKTSITILHGTKDEIIPFSQSIQLKKEFPEAELVTIQNGKHNNLARFDRFRKKMDSVLIK